MYRPSPAQYPPSKRRKLTPDQHQRERLLEVFTDSEGVAKRVLGFSLWKDDTEGDDRGPDTRSGSSSSTTTTPNPVVSATTTTTTTAGRNGRNARVRNIAGERAAPLPPSFDTESRSSSSSTGPSIANPEFMPSGAFTTRRVGVAPFGDAALREAMNDAQPHVSFFGDDRGAPPTGRLTQERFNEIPSVRDRDLTDEDREVLFQQFASAVGQWFKNPAARDAALHVLASHGVDLDELAYEIDLASKDTDLTLDEQFIFNYYERHRLQGLRPRYQFARIVAGKRKQPPEVFLDTGWIEQMINDVTIQAQRKYVAIVEAGKRITGIDALTRNASKTLKEYQDSIGKTLDDKLPDLLAFSNISVARLQNITAATTALEALMIDADGGGPSLFKKNSTAFPRIDDNLTALAHTSASYSYAVYADMVLIEGAVARAYTGPAFEADALARIKERTVTERASLGILSASAVVKNTIAALTIPSDAQKLSISQTLYDQLSQVETPPDQRNATLGETTEDRRKREAFFEAIPPRNIRIPYLTQDRFYVAARQRLAPLTDMAVEALLAFGNADAAPAVANVLDSRWATFCNAFSTLATRAFYNLETALAASPSYSKQTWFLNKADATTNNQRIFYTSVPVAPYIPYAVADPTTAAISLLSPTAVESFAVEKASLNRINAEPWARPAVLANELDVEGLRRSVDIHTQLIETLYNPARIDAMALRTSADFKTKLLFLLEQRVGRVYVDSARRMSDADNASVRLVAALVRDNSGSAKLLSLYTKAKDLLRFVTRSETLTGLSARRRTPLDTSIIRAPPADERFKRTDGSEIEDEPNNDFVFELFTDGNPNTGVDTARVLDQVIALQVLINAEEAIASTAATQFLDLRLGVLLVAIRYHVVRTMLQQIASWLLVDVIRITALLESDKRAISDILRSEQQTVIVRDDSDPRERAAELAIQASPFALKLDEFNGSMLSAINSAERMIRYYIPNFDALAEIDKGAGADSELLSALQDATDYCTANDVGMAGGNPETTAQTARLDQEAVNIRYRLVAIKRRLGV
jgi:hypothetical protein